jgi:NosR/NirI family nitrous oxide reductase transcriptional regulator
MLRSPLRGTRRFVKRRLLYLTVIALLSSLYLFITYQASVSAATPVQVQQSSSQDDAQLYTIPKEVLLRVVNESNVAFVKSAGDLHYYIVASSTDIGDTKGLLYLTTDISPEWTYGYNSMISVIVYVNTTGTIKSLMVWQLRESWGYLVTDDWVNSLVGRNVFEPLVVGYDVDGITRATYTSTGIVAGVREAGRKVVDNYPFQPPSSLSAFFLMIGSMSGKTDPPAGTYYYGDGQNVSVTALPTNESRFDHWLLDGNYAGNSSTITLTMDRSHVLFADFASIIPPPSDMVSLFIGSVNGTTNPPPGVHLYQRGQKVQVTAFPGSSGVRFDHWDLDGLSLDGSSNATITMDKDHVLVAVFAAPQSAPPTSTTPHPLALVDIKDALGATALFGLFGTTYLAYRSNNERLKYAVLIAAVAFIGFYWARMVSIVDITQLSWSTLPPLFRNIYWYSLYGLVLLTSVIWGRLYCGYLCPFGAFIEILNRQSPLKLKLPLKVHSKLVYAKYIVLAVIVLGVLAGAAWITGIETFQTFFLFRGDLWMWAVLVAALVLSVPFKRFYCSYICPAGAVLSLAGAFRLLEINRWPECGRCKICERACPEGAIVGAKISALECMNCRVCEENYLNVGLCPHYANEGARLKAARVSANSTDVIDSAGVGR